MDNLRYVYSIKQRHYHDELKNKTARTKSGELEYTGRWKFFDCLSFLCVHSEPFRAAVVSPMLHFEEEQLSVVLVTATLPDFWKRLLWRRIQTHLRAVLRRDSSDLGTLSFERCRYFVQPLQENPLSSTCPTWRCSLRPRSARRLFLEAC
ncbi:hypothetical protein V5799_008573 [Amblyomma americanum]|uniref:Uncharacterized protein n=1 Tax=Amblyomma americanum TaxID=6943 RepID=A0AAQ4FEH3_AMBAM